MKAIDLNKEELIQIIRELTMENAALRPLVTALAGYEPHYYPEKGFQCHYCHRFSWGPLDTFPHTATCAVRLSQGWEKKWKEI